MRAVLILLLVGTAMSQQIYLNNAAITFSLTGQGTYVPSTGGAPIPGYLFTLGFDRFSWLGIQFMAPTSSSNYDTLVLQRSATSTGGAYTCSIQDFYISSGRPGVLMNDMITSMDKSVTTTSSASAFQLTMYRTIGNTSGEDWEGGNFADICFFTSDSSFSQSSWSQQYSACFGFQIDGYRSTYRGVNLGSMNFEGVNSKIYGGIYGPFLELKLFWYRNSLTMTNTSNIYIQIGSQINSAVGYDYFQCGVGDFYGSGIGSLQSDLEYSGYSNGACIFNSTASGVYLDYTRDVYTYDSFDSEISSSFTVCLIGTTSDCATVSPPYLVPTMSVQSALQIYSQHLVSSLILLMSLLLALAL